MLGNKSERRPSEDEQQLLTFSANVLIKLLREFVLSNWIADIHKMRLRKNEEKFIKQNNYI